MMLPPVLAYATALRDASPRTFKAPLEAIEVLTLRSFVGEGYDWLTLNYGKVIEIETREHRCIVVSVPCGYMPANLEQRGITPPARIVYERAFWALMRQPTSADPADPDQWTIERLDDAQHIQYYTELDREFRELPPNGPMERVFLYAEPPAVKNHRPVRSTWLPDRTLFRLIRHTDDGVWNPDLVARVRDELRRACEKDAQDTP